MLSKPANGKQKIIIPTTSCTALSWNRGLGVDNRRWRWRLAASLDEGAMAADQRLVRPAFGRFGLSGNGLVLKTRGSRSQVMFGLPLLLSFSSRGELLWRSEVDLTVISSHFQ